MTAHLRRQPLGTFPPCTAANKQILGDMNSSNFNTGSFNSINDSEEHRLYPRSAPQAMSQSSPNVMEFLDPQLCVTPEKPLRKSTISNIKDRSLDSSKGSQKVRFDSTVEVKHMTPPETSTDTSNFSSIGIDTSQNSSSERLSCVSELSQSSDTDSSTQQQSSSLLSSSGSSESKASTWSTVESEDVDFVDVLASDLETKEALIYGKKRIHHKAISIVRPSVWGEDGIGDNILSRPEFNSTILMRKELEELKDADLDVQEAVKQKLKLSEETRSKVAEKVFKWIFD